MGIKEQLQEMEYELAKGLEKAYEKMILFKKQKNSPVVISKNGKVVKVDPDKIQPTTLYER